MLKVPGRLFDVATHYMAPDPDADRERTPEERIAFVKAQLRDLILAYYGLESPFPEWFARGTTLVFLPGAEEIADVLDFCAQVADGVGERRERPPVQLFPLHSRLSTAQQTEALRAEPGAKRIVAATNIAETSLTVPDCSCVIDSALVKVLYYRPQQHCDVLQTKLVDRSSLVQRRGRAGRVSAGLYVCALTEAEAEGLERQRPPEIARVQPDRVIMDIVKISGGRILFKDLLQFPLMHPIPYRLLSEGVRRLERLRCLCSEAQAVRLTKLGRQVQQFPVDIQMGLALQEARRRGCLADCAKAAAVISAGLQLGPGEYASDYEGFVDLFDRILLKRAPEVGRQLQTLVLESYRQLTGGAAPSAEKHGLGPLRQCLCVGFQGNIAQFSEQDRCYYRVSAEDQPRREPRRPGTLVGEGPADERLFIHPSSKLFGVSPRPRTVLFGSLLETRKKYMLHCCEVTLDGARRALREWALARTLEEAAQK